MTKEKLLPEKVIVSPDALYEDLGGQVAILHIQRERYYTLDDIGTDIWHLLIEKGNVAEVLEQLLKDYDVDEATLTHDLTELIAKLHDAELISFN
jgi:hypothetical protein